MTDKAIREAVRNGDEKTMGLVIEKYSRLLWSVVSAILINSADDADMEEVVADVFIHFWQYPEKYDPAKGKLSAYLAMVARSRAIDRYRKIVKKGEVPLEEDALFSRMEPLTGIIAREERQKLRVCLEALDEEDSDILIRRFYHNQKPREIADVLGITVKQTENRLYQAKKRLRRQLEACGD